MSSDEEVSESEAFDRALAFLRGYAGEPARVAVILATSRMDFLLARLVEARLLPCPDAHDRLLDSERGIGTLEMRISLAQRLGIVDARLARRLQLFRRIRNDFAHSFESMQLEDPPHVDRIMEITSDLNLGKKHRGDFLISSAITIAELEEALDVVHCVDDDCAREVRADRD